MISITDVKAHILAVEEATTRAQLMPPKARKKETDKWIGVRNSLLHAVALLDANPNPDALERQHAANVKKLNNYHSAKATIPRGAKQVLAELDAQYAPTNLKKSLEFLNYILQKNNDLLCGVLSFASSPA